MDKPAFHVVVTFHTSYEAMAMRKAGIDGGLQGRLIAVPQQLSAGCGLAWSEPAENEAALRTLMAERKLEYEQVNVIEL